MSDRRDAASGRTASEQGWYDWAAAQGLQPHEEVAARAAVALLRTGATAVSAAAAAHITASRGTPLQVQQLGTERAWVASVIEDLKRNDAPASLVERYQSRLSAVVAAIEVYDRPEAQAALQSQGRWAREAEAVKRLNAEARARDETEARERAADEQRRGEESEAWRRRAAGTPVVPNLEPVATVPVDRLGDSREPMAPAATAAARPAKPAAPAPPPRPPAPPRPSLQEFLSEHSILVVSYTGAFLLFIATLLFELYTINLNGYVRFGGVLVLDLIFAAAGVGCLRSKRLRLVGQTYVAIFALLAPLVFVAAYVFLALHAKGISTDLAFVVAGSACLVLYLALTLRLRLHAYGVLALLALPVAWFGIADLLEPGLWRGVVMAPLALVYTLVLYGSPRWRLAADLFSRFALPFVHAAAIVSVGLTFYSLASHDAGFWVPWVGTSTAALLALAYIAFRALGGPRYGATIALTAVGLAAAGAVADSGLGVWRPATLSPLVALYTILQLRPQWLGSRARLFSDDARYFVHAAAAAVVLGIGAEAVATDGWIRWGIALTLTGVAAGYGLNRVLGGEEVEASGAQAAFGLAWFAVVHDVGIGAWGAVVATPLMVVYAVAQWRSFSRYGGYFIHATAVGALLLLAVSFSDLAGFQIVEWPAAALFAGLTAGYLVRRAICGGELSAHLALASFGVTWLLVVVAGGSDPWRGAEMAPLAAVYAVLASRRWSLLPANREHYIHGALTAGAALLATDMLANLHWMPAAAAVTAMLFAAAYLTDTALNGRLTSAYVAIVLFGVAWVATVDALHLGWWRGAAITPLAIVYAVLAFRGARLGAIGELLGRHARDLVHAAVAVALLFAFGDMVEAGGYIPWTGTATVAGITVAYLLFAVLGVSVEGALLCQVAFGATWTLAVTDLHLGVWRGPSLTLLVALYGFIAYRGARLGRAGALFTRFSIPRVHSAAALALLLTAYSAVIEGGWVSWTITATFAGLALAYLFLCLLGAPAQSAALSLGAFGLAFGGATQDLGLGNWRSTAIAVLPALYALAAFRGARLGVAGTKFANSAPPFVYAGGAAAVAVLMFELGLAGAWIPWAAAVTFAVLALAYLAATSLGGDFQLAFIFKVAFGAAWVIAAHELVPGPWWPAAVTPLVALYALLAFRGSALGDVGRRLADTAVHFVDGAAVVVVILAVVEVVIAGAWLGWSLTIAAAGIAASYLFYCLLGGGAQGAVIAMAALLVAWGGGAQDLQLGAWRGTAVAALALGYTFITFRAKRLGRVGALFGEWSEAFVHPAAAVGLLWSTLGGLPRAPMAAVLAVIAIVYAVYGWLSRRQPALLVTAVAVTFAAGFETNALGLGNIYFAVELTLLAAAAAYGAGLAGDLYLRYGLRAWMAVEMIAVATLYTNQRWIQALNLLVCAAVVAWVAWSSKEPAWLLLAFGLFSVDWYWLVLGQSSPAETLTRAYGPLVLVFGLCGLALRSLSGRRWAWPAYVCAGGGAVSVVYAALDLHDLELAGVAVLAYSVVLYATSAVERFWPAAVGAGLTMMGGFGLLLYSAGAAPEWYPVAAFATSAALYALQVPWELRFKRESDWVQSHRLTGLGGAAISSLSTFAFTGVLTAHSWGALAAAAGIVGFGAMVVIDGRRHALPELDYVGAVLASLAGLWIAFYLGAHNVEWYVIVPGGVIVASGLRLPYDSRVRLPQPRLIAQVLTGIGLLLTLGTSAVLTVLEPPNAWIYTSALVVEGVAALLAGLGLRSRVLLIGGGVAIAVSALRAIFVGLTQGWLPVWAVFFVVSIILLGLGAALALMRDRLPEARLKIGDAWRDWN